MADKIPQIRCPACGTSMPYTRAACPACKRSMINLTENPRPPAASAEAQSRQAGSKTPIKQRPPLRSGAQTQEAPSAVSAPAREKIEPICAQIAKRGMSIESIRDDVLVVIYAVMAEQHASLTRDSQAKTLAELSWSEAHRYTSREPAHDDFTGMVSHVLEGEFELDVKMRAWSAPPKRSASWWGEWPTLSWRPIYADHTKVQ
jgi:hypothetical protein